MSPLPFRHAAPAISHAGPAPGPWRAPAAHGRAGGSERGARCASCTSGLRYSWHFPELVKIVNDNYLYARVALIVKDKGAFTEDKLPEITEVLGDEAKAQEVRALLCWHALTGSARHPWTGKGAERASD